MNDPDPDQPSDVESPDSPVTVSRRRSWIHILIGGTVSIAAILTFIWFYRGHYAEGRYFVPGLHFFGFLRSLAVLAPVVLGLLILLVFMHYIQRRRLSPSARAVTWISSTLLLILMLLSMPAFESAFRAGRSEAYRTIDYSPLAVACGDLVRQTRTQPDKKRRELIDARDAEFQELPALIQRLKPLFVHVASNGVVLQMDGGGPAAHEGLWIPVSPLNADVTAYAREHDLLVLNAAPPVFCYALYDYRCLPLASEP